MYAIVRGSSWEMSLRADNAMFVSSARVLKKRGVLLFRDYAKADVKNNGSFSPGQEIDPSVFVRPDGTLAAFVDEAFVASTFANIALVGTTEIVTHTVTNRKLYRPSHGYRRARRR